MRMRFDPKVELDATDWRLVGLLCENARLSYAELGRKLRLSPPAVAERMRRLEDRGIVRGYRADLDLSKLGRGVQVFFRVVVQPHDYPRFQKEVDALEEILECHHVTGQESFVLRAAVPAVADLEALIQRLTKVGPTTTSVILSTTKLT